MYKSKYLTGLMSIPDLARSEVGVSLVYEVSIPETAPIASIIKGVASRLNATLRMQSYAAFDTHKQPHYFIKVTVIKSGTKI